MFYNYDIKMVNNEEVLYIYCDDDFEFSLEFLDNLGIKNMLKKINFKGNIVKFLVGGIVVSTIFLNSNNLENNNIVNVELNKPIITLLKEKIDLNYDDNVVNEKTDSSNIVEKKINIENNNNNINTSIIKKSSVNINTNTEQNKVEKQEVKKDISNDTILILKRSSGNISIELEQYLIGVVGAEMPASFNIEALKAQAVVARTYALKRIENNLVLTDSVTDQVYKDNNQLKAMWGSDYNTYYNKVKNAVDSTKGQYISYNGTYIDALYHSTSNGKTEDSKEVWGNSYNYLKSVDSHWDKSATSYERNIDIDYKTISDKLGVSIDKNSDIQIISRTSSNRVKTIKINDTYYTGVEVRNHLGLRSADFEIIKNENGLSIKTYGYGHGVGMSQYGASSMAKEGYSYIQIIKHYYSGVSILTKS